MPACAGMAAAIDRTGRDTALRFAAETRLRLLRLAADDLRAGSSRHVNPRVGLVVFRRGAGARARVRLAVVGTPLGDAIALLGLECRLRRRAGLRERETDDSGAKRAGHCSFDPRILHGELLLN